MAVVKRGQSYQVSVSFKGRRYRPQFPSEIEAQRWELDAKESISKGIAPTMPNSSTKDGGEFRASTIGQLMDYMIEHHWRGKPSEKSATINGKHIVSIVGADTALRAITSHTINLAISRLKEEGYPETTINKKMSPLRMCLKYAMTEGWIDRMPRIAHFKQAEGRIRWFSDEEERQALDWCRANGEIDLMDYIIVSLDTGMRQAEALNLTTRNLYDDAIILWGARTERDNGTKAGNTRSVPLTARAADILRRRADGNAGKLINLTKDQLRERWDTMREALGYMDDPEYVPHVLRHTFCTRLVVRNVNLVVVQRLAGHKRIETTCKYVHPTEDSLVRAIKALAPREDNVYAGATSAPADMSHANVA